MPEADKPHGNLFSSEFLTAAEEGLLGGAAEKCRWAPSPLSAPIVSIEAIMPKDGVLCRG